MNIEKCIFKDNKANLGIKIIIKLGGAIFVSSQLVDFISRIGNIKI